jgi:P-type conjugative transfer protein TrbL
LACEELTFEPGSIPLDVSTAHRRNPFPSSAISDRRAAKAASFTPTSWMELAVLYSAWLVVVASFFVLAIQLFVTLIEFKLTTLSGFVLVPFGLFGKTAFLAERVLGNIIGSGVKILVLAVIVGIGTNLFSQFTQGFGGNQPTVNDVLALALAALTLLGLGIFGPASRLASQPARRS